MQPETRITFNFTVEAGLYLNEQRQISGILLAIKMCFIPLYLGHGEFHFL